MIDLEYEPTSLLSQRWIGMSMTLQQANRWRVVRQKGKEAYVRRITIISMCGGLGPLLVVTSYAAVAYRPFLWWLIPAFLVSIPLTAGLGIWFGRHTWNQNEARFQKATEGLSK